jgi:hypothetical protein
VEHAALGVVGDIAMCADRPTIEWISDLMATNTEPEVAYMLTGGSDSSASDPLATSVTPIQEPPHWMLIWPMDPKTSGLTTIPKQPGTWITYAGTPWAHLIINQRPLGVGSPAWLPRSISEATDCDADRSDVTPANGAKLPCPSFPQVVDPKRFDGPL